MGNTNETQVDFIETPYHDEAWEIVGEPPKAEKFEPMDVKVIKGDKIILDKMFADYGGIDKSGAETRYHLPENEDYKPVYADTFEEEKEAEAKELAYQEQLEKIREESYQEGRMAALEESVSMQNDKLKQVEEQIKVMFADLNQQINEKVDGIEHHAVELSLHIAKKIMGSIVEVNPEYIIPIIQQALDVGGASFISSILVSPQDYEFLELVGLMKTLREEGQTWEFKPDTSIKAGCILETNTGVVDFDLDKAWERIAEKVVEVK